MSKLFDAETALYGVGDVGHVGAGVEGHHVFKHECVAALGTYGLDGFDDLFLNGAMSCCC